jgi:predicted DNA-binding transcriptional regulator
VASDKSQSLALRGLELGEEPVRRILKSVGLTEKETDVYIFLAKHDALKGNEIAKQTRVDKAEVYRILKSLQSKGLLESTLEAPARFATVPFDKVIDAFVKARRDEAMLIESAKEDLMNDWAKISRLASERTTEKFVVLEGDDKVYPRIFQLIKETKNQLYLILSLPDLVRAAQFGLFDAFLEHSSRPKIQFRFLTELTEKDVGTMKILLRRLPQTGLRYEGRTPPLGLRLSPRIVVRDDEEILFFVTPRKEKISRGDQADTCLWTNCKTLVQSFTTVFADLWEHSIEIEKRILDIEAGKPAPMLTILDAETALKKYDETLGGAKEEVIMMTSWEGVTGLCEDTSMLRTLAGKGVSFKVMAPIVDLKVYESLSKHCEVRHSQETQLRTTLVDGQHLFQFKNPSSQATPFPETAIYTNRLEYVQKTRAVLYDIWKKARSPKSFRPHSSTEESEAAVGSLWDQLEYGVYRKWLVHVKEREEGTVTEKDIINKIVNAKRLSAKDPMKDMNIQYGSTARAVIHRPSHFNLPDMIIKAFHENKQSSFGAEDWLEISLWLETPKGYAFVPAAHVTDNPKAAEWRKGVYAGTPAGQNSILVKKNQLQVTVQGNTLFAGWTVPIPLLLPKYVLPPACMLFEGFGELKTDVLTTSVPSGRTQVTERNWLRAFATFFHPASTYQAPGTDGVLFRERVMTAYPPKSSKH